MTGSREHLAGACHDTWHSSFTADLATSKAQKHLGRVDASTSLVTLHKRVLLQA